MKQKVVILQPGKIGDFIISAPIAQFYFNQGYEVIWAAYPELSSFFRSIPYVKCMTFNNLRLEMDEYKQNPNVRSLPWGNNLKSQQNSVKLYSLVRNYCFHNPDSKLLDISWALPGAKQEHLVMIGDFSKQGRNWIDMRYSLAGVDLRERWNFSWDRNEERENELLSIVEQEAQEKYGTKDFSIVHDYYGNPNTANGELDKIHNKIIFRPIGDFEVYDWYKVLLSARTIACVDSCLCNFVEVVPSLKGHKKYYLGTEEKHYHAFMRNILLNNWTTLDEQEIISDYEI